MKLQSADLDDGSDYINANYMMVRFCSVFYAMNEFRKSTTECKVSNDNKHVLGRSTIAGNFDEVNTFFPISKSAIMYCPCTNGSCAMV